MTTNIRRRHFLQSTAVAATGGLAVSALKATAAQSQPEVNMSFGLVTYQWGRDWDLPTLLKHCEACDVLGVELRTTHAHKVEPSLTVGQRKDVQKRFADSRVTLVGLGSNERFDNPDPAVVKKAIADSKAFIELSHDVGGTGVKVKPDRFYPNVPREKTIAQIGKALNELGQHGAGYGQEVRLEVHGQCGHLPTIKKIMDVADHPNVRVCWNCNPTDLEGAGLKANFEMVRSRLGHTLHVREFETEYPYADLIKLLVDTEYHGWVLMEAHTFPEQTDERVEKLKAQRKAFKQLIAKAVG